MTVTLVSEPVGARDLVATELNRRSHRAAHIAALRGAPSTTTAIPLYILGRGDVSLGDPFSVAKQIGWRYLLVGGDAPGLVSVSTRKGHLEFAGVSSGLLAQRLLDAATLADQDLDPQAQSYELRLLDAPSLRMLAVWLRGPSSVFIPLMEGVPPGSASLRIETETDFVALLKSRTAERRESPRPGGSPTN